jgi:hypothetical protein
MRNRKLLIVGGAFAVIAVAIMFGLSRPVGPLIALTVSEVEAIQVLPEDIGGRQHWAATFEVTNLTSSSLSFAEMKARVVIRVGENWQASDGTHTVSYLQSHQRGKFTLLLPEQSETCQFLLECIPDPLRERVDHFFNVCGFSSRFPRLCRWLVDHCPQRYRHLRFELSLPKTPTTIAPTYQGDEVTR